MEGHEVVKKLGALSRIDIPESELNSFAKEFESILSYVGELEKLSLAQSSEGNAPARHNVFRADENPHEAGAYSKEIVDAFPEKKGQSLTVKKILSYDE